MKTWQFICLSSFCLGLAIVALALILANNYSGEYEVSIYFSNISPVVWVLLCASMAGSIFLLVEQSLNGNRQGKLWLVALGGLAFVGLIILLLPILKGYYSPNRYDTLEHIGYVKDLVWWGQIIGYNIYPALHSIPAVMASITGMAPEIATNCTPAIFSVIYVVSMYFLAKSVLHNNGERILAVTASAVLMIPHAGRMAGTPLIAMLFPLTLWLLIQSWQAKPYQDRLIYQLIFIAWLALVPFVHPMAVVLTVLALGTAWVLNRREMGYAFPSCGFIVLVLVYLAWYRGRAVVGIPEQFVTELFFGAQYVLPAQQVKVLLAKGGVSGLGVLVVAMKLYGGGIIFSTLASLTVFGVIRNWIKRRKQENGMVFLATIFLLFCFLFVMYWLSPTPSAREFFERIIYFVPPVAIMLATPVLYRLAPKMKSRTLAVAAVTAVIIAVGLVSIFNKYPSPYTYRPNQQCTYKEIQGATWLLEHGNPSLNVKHIGIPLRKYGVATYGQVWYTTHYNSEGRQSYKSYSDARILIPDHFGYDHHEQIGELFTVPTYLILTKHDRLVYEEAWKPPIPTRWGKDDFAKLEADPSAYLEYGNGDFEVWRIWPVLPRLPEWAEMLYER